MTIPKYGEYYNIQDNEINLEGRLELESVKRIQRVEIINKVKMIKDEMSDMEEILKTEILTEDVRDDEINSITLKLIIGIIE